MDLTMGRARTGETVVPDVPLQREKELVRLADISLAIYPCESIVVREVRVSPAVKGHAHCWIFAEEPKIPRIVDYIFNNFSTSPIRVSIFDEQ